MSNLLLGIDLGTSSVKVGLLTTNGELLGACEAPTQLNSPRPGWMEITPDSWWNALPQALDKVADKTGRSKEEIAAIGISSLCPALIPFDSSNQVLHPAIIYLDNRSERQANQALQGLDGGSLQAETGNSLAAGTISASSMLWLKQNRPDIYENTNTFGHGNSYLGCKLTGNLHIDPSNASLTGVYNTGELEWSSNLCASLGISEEKLPSVIESTAPVGTTTQEAANFLDLRSGIPVAMGGADTACAAFYLGISQDGDVFETSGSSTILGVCSDAPTFDRRFLNRAHVLSNKWLFQGAMSTTGSALKWFKNEICRADEGGDFFQRMSRKLKQQGLESGRGPVFLPYLQGERSPIWDQQAQGALVGLTMNTTRVDLFRSILEGVAFGLKQISSIIEEDMGKSYQEIMCTGKGASNRPWTQIKANLLQKKMHVSSNKEAALSGAAMLGGISAEVYESPTAALRTIDRTRELDYSLDPNTQNPDRYRRLFEVYNALYPDLKDEFHNLNQA